MLTVKQGLAVVAGVALIGLGGWATWKIAAPMLAKARAEKDLAQDAQASAELSAEGAEQMAGQSVEHVAQAGRIMERTYVIREEARAAPDAGEGLGAGRLDRLREHDRFLCGERPVCGPAAGDAAATGD